MMMTQAAAPVRKPPSSIMQSATRSATGGPPVAVSVMRYSTIHSGMDTTVRANRMTSAEL